MRFSMMDLCGFKRWIYAVSKDGFMRLNVALCFDYLVLSVVLLQPGVHLASIW